MDGWLCIIQGVLIWYSEVNQYIDLSSWQIAVAYEMMLHSFVTIHALNYKI